MHPNRPKILLGIAAHAVIFTLFVGGFVSAQGQGPGTPGYTGPNLEIPIPGIEFSGIVRDNEFITIPWLAQYIGGVYAFLISIVGLFAATVMIFGGFQYATSAGDKAKIGAAKKRMANAFIGLILVFGSYTILYAINPALTSFEGLRLVNVNLDAAGDSHTCEDSECVTGVSSDQQTSTTTVQPKAKRSLGGAYKSNLAEAQKNRTATINFEHFGKVDFSSYGRRKLKDVKLVVVHNGGWDAKSIVSGWQSSYEKTGDRAAAHYTIDRQGNIYQFINDEAIVVHGNGANKSGIGIEMNIDSWPLSKPGANGRIKRGTSCNSLGSKATATSVDAACALTSAQYDALKKLIADIIARTGVTLDEDHIIGHCEAAGATHGDPKGIDWSKLGLNNQLKKDRVARLKADPNWAGSTPCGWYKPY